MKVIPSILSLLLASGVFLSARASDWVEGPASEFTVTRESQPAPRHSHLNESTLPRTDNDEGGNTVVGVTDKGGPMKPGPAGMKPIAALQGGVSRWQPGYGQPNQWKGANAAGDKYYWAQDMKTPPKTATVSAKQFRGWIDQTHPELNELREQLDEMSIVELNGEWDDSGHVLRQFSLPYKRISPKKIDMALLGGTSVMIVDCAGEIPVDSLQILKKFVLNGGYLITTDWSLENCTQRAFPGILEWNGGYSGSFLADATSMYPDSPYFKNVPPEAYWKLDNKCQTVRVRRRDMVKPLVRSRYLLQDDPDQIGILACTFDYGKGKVLHVVGHFDNNSDLAFNNALPDPSAIGISMRQAIMANFIVEGLEAHKQQAPADAGADSEK